MILIKVKLTANKAYLAFQLSWGWLGTFVFFDFEGLPDMVIEYGGLPYPRPSILKLVLTTLNDR